MRGRTYIVPHRRRREGKTDYRLRLRQLKSNKLRFCVRKSLNNITCQIIQYKPNGDITLVSSDSKELKQFGWPFHGGNIPSAYLTGYLCGLKAKKKKIDACILDVGLYPSVKSSRIYATLKGAVESGLKIPYSKKILPPDERAKGAHIAQFAGKLKKNEKQYKERFSVYLKIKARPEDIEKVFETVKAKLKA